MQRPIGPHSLAGLSGHCSHSSGRGGLSLVCSLCSSFGWRRSMVDRVPAQEGASETSRGFTGLIDGRVSERATRSGVCTGSIMIMRPCWLSPATTFKLHASLRGFAQPVIGCNVNIGRPTKRALFCRRLSGKRAGADVGHLSRGLQSSFVRPSKRSSLQMDGRTDWRMSGEQTDSSTARWRPFVRWPGWLASRELVRSIRPRVCPPN